MTTIAPPRVVRSSNEPMSAVNTAAFLKALPYSLSLIEHIIAEKHGGTTSLENLALACPYCNRAKGTDLGSID